MIGWLYRRLIKKDEGVSAVEFAIILPILLLLLIGIIEFGWLLNGYITITGGAREGARLAVLGKNDSEIETAVKEHTVDLMLSGDLRINTSRDIPGEETVVTVSGDLPLLVGFFNFLGDPFTISADATMRQEIGYKAD